MAGCQQLSLGLAPTWELTTPPLVSAPPTTGGTLCELMREDMKFSIFPEKVDHRAVPLPPPGVVGGTKVTTSQARPVTLGGMWGNHGVPQPAQS